MFATCRRREGQSGLSSDMPMNDRTDRLDTRGTHGIRPTPRMMSHIVEDQAMPVPASRQVEAFTSTAPEGGYMTAPQGGCMDVRAPRRALARKDGAGVTCPAIFGYHARRVAAAASGQPRRGVPEIEVTPFRRMLDAATPTARRLRFGAEFVGARRRRQGLQD